MVLPDGIYTIIPQIPVYLPVSQKSFSGRTRVSYKVVLVYDLEVDSKLPSFQHRKHTPGTPRNAGPRGRVEVTGVRNRNTLQGQYRTQEAYYLLTNTQSQHVANAC